MDINVSRAPGAAHAGTLEWQGRTYPCVLGRAGISAAKQEGDGVTPVGRFALKDVLFRADRMPPPKTGLPIRALDPDDGWCDDPSDGSYNRLVQHPYPASAERLWREDGRYDVIVVIGHNTVPVIPGAGSAIFVHVAGPDKGPTEGCVALALADLLDILTRCGSDTHIRIANQ